MSDSFSDWVAKMAEAQCVLSGIQCKRKFTDAELERPLQQLRAQNAYAEVMIMKDRMERYEGRPDQDLDTFGRPLRAGS